MGGGAVDFFSNVRSTGSGKDRPGAIVQLRGRSIEKFVALNAPGRKDLSGESVSISRPPLASQEFNVVLFIKSVPRRWRNNYRFFFQTNGQRI